MLERGFISRTTRCLFQRGLAPLVPSTVESLRKLHLPSSGAPCPILPDSAPRIHVDGVVLSGLVMRKVANGSAPGPSGWTGELIKALVGDADCLAGLVALVEDIINGDLDDSARKYLLSSSLIASEKDSGGFRPIAIGDVFYRLACHYVLQLVQPSAAALLEPIQLAQSRGGCERAIHLLQASLECKSEDSAILSIDFLMPLTLSSGRYAGAPFRATVVSSLASGSLGLSFFY